MSQALNGHRTSFSFSDAAPAAAFSFRRKKGFCFNSESIHQIDFITAFALLNIFGSCRKSRFFQNKNFLKKFVLMSLNRHKNVLFLSKTLPLNCLNGLFLIFQLRRKSRLVKTILHSPILDFLDFLKKFIISTSDS